MPIEICHHELDIIVPSSEVHLLLFHPFVRLEQHGREPFRWDDAHIPRQLQSIQALLEIAKNKAPHPTFVLLPEYSVPGINGVQAIRDVVETPEFPSDTIVIGGVDGLTKGDYAALVDDICRGGNTCECNAPDNVNAHAWVNCSVTWAKDHAGHVTTWIQPKIEASWPEENITVAEMFRGGAVNVFQARFDNNVACRFVSMICYDWIGRATQGGNPYLKLLLEQLNNAWTGEQKKLHWAFLLQHNPKPNHYTFTTATRDFLSDSATYPSVDRSDAAVVVVSTAGKELPARTHPYGYSGVVYSPRAPFECGDLCAPSVTSRAKNLDPTRDLGTCKDLVLREMGECIHACAMRVPGFVTADPTDRRRPLKASVYRIRDDDDDPRRPNGPVPAALKWLNDSLDVVALEALSTSHFNDSPLKAKLVLAELKCVEGFRQLGGEACESKIRLSTPLPEERDADAWSNDEHEGLRHAWQTLVLCAAGIDISVPAAVLHGVCATNGVEVAAVRARSHEECRDHYEQSSHVTHGGVLLVTRDRDNTHTTEAEITKFYEVQPEAGLKVVDYQSLFNLIRRAPDENALAADINALVTIDDRRII